VSNEKGRKCIIPFVKDVKFCSITPIKMPTTLRLGKIIHTSLTQSGGHPLQNLFGTYKHTK
jgi:hypothetical protein